MPCPTLHPPMPTLKCQRKIVQRKPVMKYYQCCVEGVKTDSGQCRQVVNEEWEIEMLVECF